MHNVENNNIYLEMGKIKNSKGTFNTGNFDARKTTVLTLKAFFKIACFLI